MKLFDVNWLDVLRNIQRWSGLPTRARHILLEQLKPHGYVPAHHFAPYLDAIVTSGIPRYDPERDRLWLGDERRGLVKVLRAMHRHPVFDRPTPDALTSYMSEHFTAEDLHRLGSRSPRGYYASGSKQALAKRIAFSGWSGDLIDARSDDALLSWAEARGARIDPTRVELSTTILRDLQALARQLLAYPDGITFRQLITEQKKKDLTALADAIYAGLGTLVIFAALRRDDLEPVIGLWPTAVRELTNPTAQRPVPVQVTEPFALAVEMEDMTTVLSAVAASPVRVRASDFAIFARARADIDPRLVALPRWADELFTADRVDHAARELQMRGFVKMRNLHGNPHIEATIAGVQWLAHSPHDRLVAMLEPLRESNDANPRTGYDSSHAIGFFPYSLPYAQAPRSLRVRDHLTRVFLDLAHDFIPLNEFLEFGARNDNPFLALPPSEITLYSGMYYGDGDPRETYRDMWRSMLFEFLCKRLIAYGGARIGLHDGTTCFALTDAGRYLLGNGDAFEYGAEQSADIVVQPNFDVVFLGNAPAVEAEIGRFAERIGTAPGLAFRLTRISVLAAAESGATVAGLIGTLARTSSKPIPNNVQREITGWMSAIRRATLRKADLLECADEDTAARIAAILGDGVRLLAPTTLEFLPSAPAARVGMIKKLRAGGVLLSIS